VNAPVNLRRGWCPSLSRPMRSGDGLLVRLNLGGRALSAQLALAVSDCARRYGNGLIDLTQRANLQLRGVDDTTLPNLRERLVALGLEAPRHEPPIAGNILAPPLVGLDQEAILDITPILASLRQRLATCSSLWALPTKFSILVEDRGRLGLADIEADIRFEAVAANDGCRFLIALGGRGVEAAAIGACNPADLPDVAVALADAFVRSCEGNERVRRMRDLIKQGDLATVAETLATASIRRMVGVIGAATALGSRTPRRDVPSVGFQLLTGDVGFFGIGAPLGRLTSDQFDAMACLSRSTGAQLRLTPWRSILLAGLKKSEALSAGRQLASADLIVDPADPRLAVTACSGAPVCARATVPARSDAVALAALARGLAPEGVVLHLSGCEKGCARAGSSRITLVGREGHYDLVLDGPASGKPLRKRLTLAEVTSTLADLNARLTQPAAPELHYSRALG
jgi:precorrin-3B synthase